MQSTSNVIDKNWKALIKPNKLDITSSEDKTLAKVVAEPLEKGFGQTIGNSLRRILLSSIQGAAVTAIQIDGVLHEFSSIKGVREDVTDIVLNVKNLAIKSSSSSTKKIILREQGTAIAFGIGVWFFFTFLWALVTTMVAYASGVAVGEANDPAWVALEGMLDLLSPNGVYHHLLETQLPTVDRGVHAWQSWLAALLWTVLPWWALHRRMERLVP